MPLGEAVLHYSILGRLGAGGMGVVYRALDTRLERVVALKFLPSAVAADAGFRERLLLEARAAARLDHPNIGTIYGLENPDGEPFIVMALYEGRDLRELLRAGPMGVAEAVDFGCQVARGLASAHDRGIVHRDIKPGNLFLTPDGVVKILDFGLARQSALDGLTRPGEILGTPAYLSPEQARGQAVDGRTDLWALGVVLYEMLTGVAPFAADAGLAAVLLRILRDEPEPVSSLRPEVPAALDAVVERALAKDPEARYGSARDLLADLETALSSDGPARVAPAAARAPSPPEPAPAAPLVAARHPPAGLPAPAGPLVGRGSELALAELHLSDPHCRILTLFGPGGTGKTRLAVEIAHEQERRERFPSGVHFVALDGLTDDGLIPAHIAATLGLDVRGQADVLALVAGHIGTKPVLMVLDNFEHLMGGAEIASVLVRSCPHLKLLVTSRERLNLEEEWVLPLGGLQTPPAQAPGGPEEVRRYEAVQLFLQRARRADVRFAPSDEDLAHVCAVCHLVAGSPLGLEMAAAWVKMVPCEEIAREIRANLDFLESSSRNVSARHRSLRATFEYSWVLLEAREQEVLRALSVFRGGFTKEAAREVAGADVRTLASLLDKSLLASSEGRYDFHPLVHQYVLEKLSASPDELARARDGHGAFFHRLLQSRVEELQGPGQAEAHRALEADLQNLRAAWLWAAEGARTEELSGSLKPLDLLLDNKGRHREAAELYGRAAEGLDEADPGHVETLGVLAARRAWAYYALGRLAEARPLAERSLAWLRSGGVGPHLVSALNVLAAIEHAAGGFARARELWEETLALARESGDRRHVAAALGNLASAEQNLGEFARARERQREALALARESDNPTGVVIALNNLAGLLLHLGEVEEARRSLEEALALSRDIGLDFAVPILLHSLGVTHFERKEYAEAEPLYREALELARERGDQAREAYILASLGGIRIARGDPREAHALLVEGLRVAWSNGEVPTVLFGLGWLAEWHASQGRFAEAVALCTMVHEHPAFNRTNADLNRGTLTGWLAELPADEAAAAQERGRGLQLEEVVERYLRGGTDGATASHRQATLPRG